uniref:Ras association domain-containing protein 8 n=2 Tax=Cacopsylla melanoneura TaxID=428564 RepID=A0A8D8MB86_9HEMI
MELKVWVEGLQKIVSGVTESTTCQDIVFALAHATGKTGRYTLIERFRNNERLLTPQDHPIKELLKLGEYANEVHFILQRSLQSATPPSSHPTGGSPSQNITQSQSQSSPSYANYKDYHNPTRKQSLFPNDLDSSSSQHSSLNSHVSMRSSSTSREEKSGSRPSSYHQDGKMAMSNNTTPTSTSQHSIPSPTSAPLLNGTTSPRKSDGGGGCLLSPPPYREPPPPTQSPARVSPPTSLTTIRVKPKKIFMKDLNGGTSTSQAHQYKELVRLINLQRDKLSSQQMELTRYDAEIMFWEGKTREQQHQMEYIAEESLKIEAVGRHTEQAIKNLGSVEEEHEIVRQQEKTLESEITLLRSKLANCETELLQCKNKIRLLMEEVQFEQRLLAKETEERHHMEKSLMREVERLQGEVDQARADTESAAQSGDKLAKEVAALEGLIVEKKKQLEKLIGDMKDANLHSLTIAPSEELKLLVDGAHKLGSTRRMIGSPRQLENAVPTSKNPHGVWV